MSLQTFSYVVWGCGEGRPSRELHAKEPGRWRLVAVAEELAGRGELRTEAAGPSGIAHTLASSLLPTLPFKPSKNNLFLLHGVTSHLYWCSQSLVLPKWEHISCDTYFLGLRYPQDS